MTLGLKVYLNGRAIAQRVQSSGYDTPSLYPLLLPLANKNHEKEENTLQVANWARNKSFSYVEACILET